MMSRARLLCLFVVALAARPSEANLERTARQDAMKAVVWIGDVSCASGGDCEVVASGSGTLLDTGGLILTNNHVVQDVDDPGAPLFLMLRVGLLRSFDRPPETVCIAYPQHALRDRALDLALIRCELDANMEPLRPGAIAFPTARLGDSTGVAPGDDVAVIGYPGVGGGTITYTTGRIAGFTSDEDLQNAGLQDVGGRKRDWIKTDAKIAPGNSGGGAFDDDGTLIGVPSANFTEPQAGVQYTMGLIRPIERAKALIAAGTGFDPLAVRDAGDENWSTVANGPKAPVGSSKPSLVTGTVRVVGQLIAGDSGEPIAGGTLIVLKPGVRSAQATIDNIEKLYLTRAKSDDTGNFALEEPLPPGSYSVIIQADGYDPVEADDALEVDKKTPPLDDLGSIALHTTEN